MKVVYPKDRNPKGAGRIRAWLERQFLRTVRLYTFNTPVSKGKYRLFLSALRLCRYSQEGLIVPTRDGRRFSIDLSSGMHQTIFFLGEYEPFISKLVTRLAMPTDNVLDVGANSGWYSSLLSGLCGPDGKVFAFEPHPRMFAELERNVRLARFPNAVTAENLALGDKEGTAELFSFEELPTGHSSLSKLGRSDSESLSVKVSTFDSYYADRSGPIQFVKVDIEGAEGPFFEGADRLFEQEAPPIIIFECADSLTTSFGYRAAELVERFLQTGLYDLYEVDEDEHVLRLLGPQEIGWPGAYVLAFPKAHFADRRASISEFIDPSERSSNGPRSI